MKTKEQQPPPQMQRVFKRDREYLVTGAAGKTRRMVCSGNITLEGYEYTLFRPVRWARKRAAR